MTILPYNLTLDAGDSYELEAIVYPKNATHQDLVWSSSDPSIAQVRETGLVIGIRGGIDTIKVATADGSMTATCIVHVMQWTSYTSVHDDLINDTVRRIDFDSQGNVWLGTNNGISRFDGSFWTGYQTSNSELLHDKINGLAIDDQDIKWIGNKYGLSTFNDADWVSYTPNNSGLTEVPVHAIAFDADGNAWIGTYCGISKFDGLNWTTYNKSNSGLIDDCISTITIDSKGNIWIGTINGVSRFNGSSWKSFTPLDGLPGYGVNVIVEDSQGIIWIGTSDGLSKYDGTNLRTYFHGTQINGLALDANGYLWVARTYEYDDDFNRISNGVSRFDGVNWKTFNTSNSGLVHNTVISISIDADNIKWFGTLGGVTQLQD